MIGGMARKPGRPPLIAPQLVKQITALAADDVPRRHILAAVGVSKSAFSSWLVRGRRARKGDEPYVELLAALKKAEAKAVAVKVRRVQAAGVGGALVERKSVTFNGVTTVTEKFSRPEWTADAWFLERRHPGEFGSDKRELAELRKLVREMAADRGTDGTGAKPPDASAKPPVERDDGPDGGRPPDETPR